VPLDFPVQARWTRAAHGPRASELSRRPQARERAQVLLRDGKDPIDAKAARKASSRAQAAKAMTFDQCAAAYIDAHAPAWRGARHRQQWENLLRDYASPVFGHLPVATIDTDLVMQALEPIWTAKTESAKKVRSKIKTILDWARVRGLRDGQNPAQWGAHLDHLLPPHSKVQRVRHHPAMPFMEMPTFMARLAEQPGVAARALAFTILTAARTGEVIGGRGRLGARWREIDLDARVWTVPASRMKSDRIHRVPLSDAAIEVLGPPGDPGDFIFPGDRGGSLSNMAMPMLLRRMGVNVTVHGFRSTFRDYCGEATDFPREIAEAALAHVVGDRAEQAYRRGDALEKRRTLMVAWAAFCTPQHSGFAAQMSEDILKDVKVFQFSLGLFYQFAERLLGQNLEQHPRGPRDIVTDEDAARIQQMQTELRELAATIAKSHQTELSRFPPSQPSITHSDSCARRTR
jgi:integrase